MRQEEKREIDTDLLLCVRRDKMSREKNVADLLLIRIQDKKSRENNGADLLLRVR